VVVVAEVGEYPDLLLSMGILVTQRLSDRTRSTYGKKTSVHGLQTYAQSTRDGQIPLFTFALLQEILSGLIFIQNQGYVHCVLRPQSGTNFHRAFR